MPQQALETNPQPFQHLLCQTSGNRDAHPARGNAPRHQNHNSFNFHMLQLLSHVHYVGTPRSRLPYLPEQIVKFAKRFKERKLNTEN
jgi:hypothetical protein